MAVLWDGQSGCGVYNNILLLVEFSQILPLVSGVKQKLLNSW